VDGISGRGADTIEMRDKSGTNGSTCKVSFHHAEFALGAVFPSIKFNSLALYRLKFALMCSISIDVSNNTRILKIDNGVVDEKSGSGGGVENVEVVVLDPRAIEVGSRMCMCMKGNGKLRVAALASPYKMSIDPNLPEGDIACHLILSVLIDEDKRLLPCITMVILAPSNSWVVWIIKLLSKLRDVGNGTRRGGKGDGGVVLSKPDWFVILHIVI